MDRRSGRPERQVHADCGTEEKSRHDALHHVVGLERCNEGVRAHALRRGRLDHRALELLARRLQPCSLVQSGTQVAEGTVCRMESNC
ncbi:hypothetical protein H257_09297 [Aphanomyces astaci]|uniref:Uncharacterized protein n=1 Tax=Aphanomyces astaci TaxID=112090 RepID=W4GC45_APHAT|nr:hypothetical protein H257_09297 [Aphanomyces astaci]ETV76861.1 hypothetical protein H257_09297 [Aphanomyces astaci]|eukprot:XP_009833773.1 hypothetical protein H257_09297 [Aphanomyces astaci]